MGRLWIAAALALGLTALSAHGAEFSWQIGGEVGQSDVGTTSDSDTATLAATYYFRPVDDSNGPYALAAFLSRTSHLGARYGEDKMTTVVPVATIPLLTPPPDPWTTIVSRAADRALSGRHVWRNTGWYAGAALAEREMDQPSAVATARTVGDDLLHRSLELGKYLGPATTIQLSLDSARTKVSSELGFYCAVGCSYSSIGQYTATLESEVEGIGVSALHVGRLGRMRYSLSGGITSSRAEATIEITQNAPLFPTTPTRPSGVGLQPAGGVAVSSLFAAPSSADRRERWALGGELFPTPTIGVRLGYARSDGDAPRIESYELGATWFFLRGIGAGVALTRAKSGLSFVTADDVDAVALRLVGRL